VEIVPPTNSLKQSTSWEADWSPARQETPRILQKLQVHYRTHNCRPPVSILSSINPIYNSPFYFLTIHINIIFPSTLKSCKWLLPSGRPHQNPVCVTPFPRTCYTHCPSYSYVFGNSNNILWTVHSIKLPVSYSSPYPCNLVRQGSFPHTNLSRGFFFASFKLSCVKLLSVDRVYCCSCLVCVVILCVFVVLCGYCCFFLL